MIENYDGVKYIKLIVPYYMSILILMLLNIIFDQLVNKGHIKTSQGQRYKSRNNKYLGIKFKIYSNMRKITYGKTSNYFVLSNI